MALKIASYDLIHLVVAIPPVFAVTRDWRLAAGPAVGLLEPFFQTIAYSIHDRAWQRIEERRARVAETARRRPRCSVPRSSGPGLM